MLSKEFYQTVISWKEYAYAFLKEDNFPNISQDIELCYERISAMEEKKGSETEKLFWKIEYTLYLKQCSRPHTTLIGLIAYQPFMVTEWQILFIYIYIYI